MYRNDLEELLTPGEVCEVLKISLATFYRLVTSGRLPAIKVGSTWRVASSEIHKMIQSKAKALKHKG